MASNWYLKTDGDDTGPLTFGQLVDLARTQSLVEADLVRSDWNDQWQRADTVVGLFHMSRKSPMNEGVLDESALKSAELTATAEAATTEIDKPQPSWMTRLLYVIRSRNPSQAKSGSAEFNSDAGDSAVGQAGSPDPSLDALPEFPSDAGLSPSIAATGSAEWSDAVGAVLARTDARSASQSASTRPAPPRNSAANRRVATCFQIVMAILCTLYVLNAVEQWSVEETALQARRTYLYQRQVATGARGNPADMESRLRSSAESWPRRYFPYLGDLEGIEYALVMLTLAMTTALMTYTLEKSVELMLHGKLFVRRRSPN
jgi:hypothetical protein